MAFDYKQLLTSNLVILNRIYLKKVGQKSETPYFFSFCSFLDIQRNGTFSMFSLTFIT